MPLRSTSAKFYPALFKVILLPMCLAASLSTPHFVVAAPADHDSLGLPLSNFSTKETTRASPLTRPALAAISIYQGIVSPQQGQVCAFEPTCSHFSQKALRQYGLFHGGLMTSDRLQRCHYCAAGHYVLSETGRSRDPIQGHCLRGEEQSPPWSLTGFKPPFSSLIVKNRRSPSAFAEVKPGPQQA
ncbi:membrane protein insertion efficiency factor YidD, partial [Candidatus Zixiibacteriota bacterium]